MVVMDDGWFGKRDDDNSSLGDWFVNEKKLGGTLSELIDRVHAQGVKFGIWIEPEMVNEDSNQPSFPLLQKRETKAILFSGIQYHINLITGRFTYRSQRHISSGNPPLI